MSSADRQNRQLLREQQQLNAARKTQEEAAQRRRGDEIKKTQAQYDHVQPRVGGGGGGGRVGGGRPSEDDAEIKVYVRECDESASEFFRYLESEGAPGSTAPSGKGAAPKRSPSAKKSVKSAGGASKRGAARPEGTATATATGAAPAPSKGKVPAYLQQRKAEMAAARQAEEDEAERRRELSKIPPGHRLVSEEEKQDTLERLEVRRGELEEELGRIPLRFDTVSIQNKRKAIQDELDQIAATKIKYSTRNALYVPIN